MSPTPRAALALALVAVSALVLPGIVVAAAAVAVVVATALDATGARHPPEIARALPASLARGRPERLEVSTAARPAVHVDVRQAAPPDVSVTPAEGRAGLDSEIVARRRGRHVLPAVAARATGPLGLGAWYHSGADEAELRVLPDMPAAYRLVEALRRSRFGEAGRRVRGPLGLGTDFEAIRDYSPDDDFRQVNWRATARLGRPMSNQYRVEQDRDVVCLLDSGRLMAAPFGEITRLDAAVDAVAAVAAVATEMDDRCGVIAFDADITRRVSPARRNTRAVVEAIHDIEPASVDSDYDLAFRTVGGGKRSLVVVLTDIIEETAARPLLDAIPVLVRRHEVIVAGAADPDLHALIATAPRGPLDAYRAAVALDVLEARTRVAARLRNAGAQVLEARPESLGAACVGAYLRAKARARV